MIKKVEFKMGRERIGDNEGPGRPKVATSDRRRDLRSIAREVGITFGSVQVIVTDVYDKSKVSARWVPRELTVDQKRTRLDI
jgi:hypothetical protein